MGKAYIAAGSNLGNRVGYCNMAFAEISKFATIISLSSIYETEPVGLIHQPDFINCVLEIQTGLEPYELLSRLLDIEDKLGRKRSVADGPRTIDLDLVFYDDLVIQEKRLTIPHPRAHLRRFVLEPLCEIAAELVHPILKVSVRKLLEDLGVNIRVRKLGKFSTAIPQ